MYIHSYIRPCVVAEICQEIPVFASVLCLNLPWPNDLISIRRWVVTLKTPTSASSPAGKLERKLASTAATTENSAAVDCDGYYSLPAAGPGVPEAHLLIERHKFAAWTSDKLDVVTFNLVSGDTARL